MPDGAPYIDIKVGGLRRRISDLDGSFERSARISLPGNISKDHLSMAQVDLEILGGTVRDHQEDVLSLLEAFLHGDNETVDRLVDALGLREGDFRSKGGGIFWAVVVVGVLCCASEAR